MSKKELIQLFGEQKVRTKWDDEKQKWFFSIVDVCGVLTDQPDEEHARNYWKVLKHRLKKEGNETVTNCNQLKLLAADGKMRLTDVADMEQMFRLIESIPSKKAEPFKQWMAEVAARRVDQMQDPELNILAEASTTEISKAQNPKGFKQSAEVAHKGGKIAGDARKKLESQIGRSVITRDKASDYLPPADRIQELPEEAED